MGFSREGLLQRTRSRKIGEQDETMSRSFVLGGTASELETGNWDAQKKVLIKVKKR